MSLVYNAVFDKNTRKLSFEDKAGNEIYSFTVPERTPAVDDITKPLTFKATQNGSTVKLTKYKSPVGDFQTSRDGGNTWTDYTIDDVITLNTGDEVSFRAKADRSAQDDWNYFRFDMTGKIEAWHNVMSMIRTNDFATYKSVVGYAFSRLFIGCTSLTKAPVLPATTLANSCYWAMFQNCPSLTEAPELPATALAVDCYYGMFQGCRSLVKAPELPATTLADRCYSIMFSSCYKLNEVRCKIPSSYSASDIESNYAKNWLSDVSSTGTFYTNADANWPSGASGIPENWTRVNERAKDDITKPLTFKATQDGSTVKLTKNGTPYGTFQTSRDGGNTWTDYTIDTAITLNTGDEVSFRAKTDRIAQSSGDFFQFNMTGKIEAWHNVMSLYRTNDFATYNTALSYAFYKLFMGCTSLTKAPVLPATTLDDYCYSIMFEGCQSLTEAPELPATTLATSCYSQMFSGCQSLTKAPELPVTTLASYCYAGMFSGCQSLTKAPELPATTLSSGCYNGMFSGCQSLAKAPELPATTLESDCYPEMFSGCRSLTKSPALPATTLAPTCYKGMFRSCVSLTEAPELPATTLAADCYISMFSGCQSLTKSPELPATTLANNCYYRMFYECRSLTKAPELPATRLADSCYSQMFSGCQSLKEVRVSATTTATNALVNWLKNVSATGDFYCNPNATIFPTGSASGVPSNWKRRNIADYPN